MSSARRRQRDISSTYVPGPVTADPGSSVPYAQQHEDDLVPDPVWYPSGPIDASILIRDPQRFYNHDRKIVVHQQPDELWFRDTLAASRLRDLSTICFQTIHNGMLMAFAERWHPDISSFHLPLSEITITLDNIACLLHILVRGTLLSHGRLTNVEVMEMLIEELGDDHANALEEVERIRGAHMRFHTLQRIYDAEFLAENQVADDEA
ncbi:uncharacterized protein LOC131614862 [Vicia villosa]|uniref:uncharacterized protein LOC131614862 n=1 Tax=Vicia villosa TaxID=3911 RepID=UPI00273BF2B8|nr:uncharacterized protein LOC131614862 [Vicia villosa]